MKNSNHASKALAVVLSGALAFAPAANAALDESNMAYTSAAEGFYGSLRVQYQNTESGGVKNDSSVDADSSRLGVGGSVDLGSGLEGFYGFEWNLGQPANDDTGLKTRQNHVGLRGDWGSVWLGAFDSVIVRFGGFSTTDITDQYGGNFEPIYRTKNALAYISPDLNGFNFGIEVAANDGKHPFKDDADGDPVADDGNDFDKIGVGASYSIQGLTFSGAYYQEQDALFLGEQNGQRFLALNDEYQGVTLASTIALASAQEAIDEAFGARIESQLGLDSDNPLPRTVDAAKADDKGQYALGIKYNQDNWVVAAMYGGEDVLSVQCIGTNLSDEETPTEQTPNNQCDAIQGKAGDATFLSLAGGVSIDKLDLHALWEQKTYEDSFQVDNDPATERGLRSYDRKTTITAITARYNLGSKASLRAAWLNNESDFSGAVPTTDDTKYAVGMRVDF